MYLIKKQYNPFIRKKDSTTRVMTDVIIALFPSIVMTWVAYGFTPVIVILVSVGSALLVEYLFHFFFRKDTRMLGDGSAIVTGILLAFTLGPFTPLPIVAVGGATAVLFGKLLWGGLGHNRFNPALVGREFMVVLFPAIMNSTGIWQNKAMENITEIVIFDTNFPFWDRLIFWPTGAMGEYSPFFLILGGFYLLARKRISWHIPLATFISFTIMLLIFRIQQPIEFTIGGLLLGTLYMATDMPTSSSTHTGKIYFGAMIGITALLCLFFGAQRGYFSYSILLLNAFVVPINWVFRPRTWGKQIDGWKRFIQAVLLTIAILATLAGILWLHHAEALIYPMILFALYSVARFILSDNRRPWGKLIH